MTTPSMLRKLTHSSPRAPFPVTHAPDADIAFSLLTDIETFDETLPQLQTFFDVDADGRQLFQSPQLLRLWWAHYGKGDAQLAVVVGFENGRPALLLPLISERAAGITVLTWLGAPIAQYGDAVAGEGAGSDDRIVAALGFAARETGADLIHLRKVRDDAQIKNALDVLGADVSNQHEAPFVDLSRYDSSEAYLKRFSSNKRKQRRRRERQLNEHGAVSFEWHAGGAAGADHAARAVRCKRESFGAAGNFSNVDETFERFFGAFAGGAFIGGGGGAVLPHVSVLASGGHVTAREIGLSFKGYYIAHVGVFDEDYKKFAPGTMQMDATIGKCIEDGMTTYDLLAPGDDYKMDFADGVVPVGDYTLKCSRIGAIYDRLIVKQTMPLLRRLKDRVMER